MAALGCMMLLCLCSPWPLNTGSATVFSLQLGVQAYHGTWPWVGQQTPQPTRTCQPKHPMCIKHVPSQKPKALPGGATEAAATEDVT